MKLNRDYTFLNYLVCDNDKAVVDAISSAMVLPGRIHNPIIIYGTIGVGKTHLLQALVGEYKMRSKIRYFTIEDFVNNMIQAIQNRCYADFIKQCLRIDALLIDDINLVKNKKSTQAELLCLFEHLYNAQKQIVVTADRPIMQIFKRKNVLFRKGIELKIGQPGYNERLRFLQAKAQNAGLQLGNDVFMDIAYKRHSSFRELEGALVKASFYCDKG